MVKFFSNSAYSRFFESFWQKFLNSVTVKEYLNYIFLTALNSEHSKLNITFLFSKIFSNSALSKMFKSLPHIIRYLTV
jgi:hypothetical protein